MRIWPRVVGVGQGILAACWFEEVGISVIGSITIAVAVGYSWYLLVRGD